MQLKSWVLCSRQSGIVIDCVFDGGVVPTPLLVAEGPGQILRVNNISFNKPLGDHYTLPI